MGFLNNGKNRMAPPPPPLPEGMTLVQESTGRTAPPPPPLPAGMTAVEWNTGSMAPPPIKKTANPSELPPPPIPDEMLRRARENKEIAKMQPIQNEANKAARIPNTRGGRPTMSLSDAVNQKAEAERKAAEEAAKPHVNANGGRLDVNDCCYARSGMDGLYYFAKIDQFDSEKAALTFFDEAVEVIKFEKIYTIGYAAEAMQCFANWNNQGNYYPAKIKNVSDNSFLVSYDENPDVVEELSFDLVRFAPW